MQILVLRMTLLMTQPEQFISNKIFKWLLSLIFAGFNSFNPALAILDP
jgi:hypothetical protein